jgi:5-methylcytosine-specific restriction endonuclease McrA
MTDDKLNRMLNEHSDVWKTKAAYFSWLRGGIRRAIWLHHPVKLEFIKANRIRVAGKKAGSTCYGGVCCICKNKFKADMLQVDHKQGNHSLRNMDDLSSFLRAMAVVTMDDLQYICKGCHTIRSYSEKHNVSFDEAKLIKQAIELEKDAMFMKRFKAERKGLTKAELRVELIEHIKQNEETK